MLRIIMLFVVLLVGCGIRPPAEKKEAELALIGSWQHVFDQEGFNTCDPNLDCKCSDVINFYKGYTFDRNLRCEYKRGNYEIKGLKDKKIQLNYISEYPQSFEYEVISSNEITLVKDNTVHQYNRKPFKVRME